MLKSFLKRVLSPATINQMHKLRAIAAAVFFGFPTRKMKVIGVTGTNGKTTTANLIAAILEAAGYRVALATTIQFRIVGQETKNTTKMTTLSPWQLQRFLARARSQKCTVAVIETTSHAIIQQRVWGIAYDCTVLTNLTHDHLDFHESLEAYREAKGRLIKVAKRAVINADDQSASDFIKISPSNATATYALHAKADVMAKKVVYETDQTTFTAITPVGQLPIELRLPGEFNIYNALAAIAVGIQQKIPLETIKQGLESVKVVRGRMETVDLGQPFTILIDYAHTPDAFEKVYATIKLVAKGQILHVFGATGDRDKAKRPIMGEIAARQADYLFITDEDPYTEDPMKIIDAVVSGVRKVREVRKVKNAKSSETWWKILDRREAIRKALTMAKPKDTVLITGKGAEEAMVIGATHVPWNDRRVIEQELTKLGYTKLTK